MQVRILRMSTARIVFVARSGTTSAGPIVETGVQPTSHGMMAAMEQITSIDPARVLEPDTGFPRGSRRLIHTRDMGWHFGQGTWLFGDPAEPDHLRKWIRNLAAGGADTYVPEAYFDGLIAY